MGYEGSQIAGGVGSGVGVGVGEGARVGAGVGVGDGAGGGDGVGLGVGEGVTATAVGVASCVASGISVAPSPPPQAPAVDSAANATTASVGPFHHQDRTQRRRQPSKTWRITAVHLAACGALPQPAPLGVPAASTKSENAGRQAAGKSDVRERRAGAISQAGRGIRAADGEFGYAADSDRGRDHFDDGLSADDSGSLLNFHSIPEAATRSVSTP